MTGTSLARSERIGPYRITEVIAQGSTSYVLGGAYEGPPGFSLPVAIKTLHGDALRSPAYVREFALEARAAAHVIHPGIVQVHALLEAGLPLLVMERVRGRSLRTLCATLALTQRSVPPSIAVAILRAAALAVHALHDGGILHCNLCPDNLLVSSSGHLKVIDFGAASWEVTERLRSRPPVIIDGHYAAPEHALARRIDRPSDVYTLGAVLDELCGPERRPDGLDAVIARALRHHPGERFATAGDLAEALDDVAAHHHWRASPTTTAAFLADTFATRVLATPRAVRRAPSEVARTRVRVRRAGGS